MLFQIFHKRVKIGHVNASSQYEAIDHACFELEASGKNINRRDLVAIPAGRKWKKAKVRQPELFER